MDSDKIIMSAMFITILGLTYYAANVIPKAYRRKRRWGVRPINRKRIMKGHFHNLFYDMKRVDKEHFAKYTRMSPECLYVLLNLIQHKLVKHNNRQTISPEHRLIITLFYLAQGCSMQVVAWSFLIGKTTVSVIVHETCAAIWEILSPIYLKIPTIEDWRDKSKRFNEQWNLPNCCGAIDGKHVIIQAPNKSGSAYFNYKKTFSIILMAVCDADYIFTLVDIGAFGSQSDGGVFKESTFGRALESGTMKLPADSPLPNTNSLFPHYFVGDEAFPLKFYILRPYPGKNLDVQKFLIIGYQERDEQLKMHLAFYHQGGEYCEIILLLM
ncbi:Protein ALP1-like [Formica fusca]